MDVAMLELSVKWERLVLPWYIALGSVMVALERSTAFFFFFFLVGLLTFFMRVNTCGIIAQTLWRHLGGLRYCCHSPAVFLSAEGYCPQS